MRVLNFISKKVFYLMLFVTNVHLIIAQDIHFSQFNNSPINLNPALIGDFSGDFRFVGNQRTQWRSVTTPYSTISISADARDLLNTPINAGLSIYSDEAGDSDFSTLQIGIGSSYSVYFNEAAHSITFGIQPVFIQRNISFDKLQFDNQYNGSAYDPSLDNGENFDNSGRNYFDLHTGINWNYTIAQRKSISAGIALHNLTTPEQTFFSNENVQLKQRITFHAKSLYKITDKIDALPSVIFAQQNKFKEIILGGSAKYHLNKGPYKAAYAGIWYRNSDASYFTVGIDYNNFHFGVSYDINISSLNVASNNRGGFEFALIYIFEHYRPNLKRYKACPDYI